MPNVPVVGPIFKVGKKIVREGERAGKRIGLGTKDVVESTLEEGTRFAKTDIGKVALVGAGFATGFGGAALAGVAFPSTALAIGAVGAGAAAIGSDVISQQSSLARAARDQARFDATLTGTASGGVTPALPDIVQPTPLPGPGEVSVQLGTGQERARRRRAKSGRGRQRVFGGAGLLVPEPEVRRQTLGGF